MAGVFPTLSWGSTVMFPLRLKITCLTRVYRGANAAEQRHAVRAASIEIDAPYRHVKPADRDEIDGFFDSQKGAFDSTWSIAFGGRTFTAMRFAEDGLLWEELIPNRWSTRLRCSGNHPAIADPPASFPLLDTGAIAQLPWSKQRAFETSLVDMESGPRHALALRAGALTGFSSDPERTWDIRLTAITPEEAEQHMAFFLARHGRLGSFDFTDPDTDDEYEDCRYGSDELQVSYLAPNHCSLETSVVKI